MKRTLFALITILIVAGFLRLYGIFDTYQFLGDQGRDAIVMSEMLKGKRLQLAGPTMSVGGFHLGPFFYYFTAPSLYLSQFDPIGPVLFQAGIGILTVLTLFLVVYRFSNAATALLAATFAAVDPTLTQFSRFSWNPNSVPFFTTLYLFCFLQYRSTRKSMWLYFCAVTLFVLGQLHYVTLLLVAPVLIQWWLFSKKKKEMHVTQLVIFFLPVVAVVVPILYSLFSKGIAGSMASLTSPSTNPQLHAHYLLFLFPILYALAAYAFTQIYTKLAENRFVLVCSLAAAILLLAGKASYLPRIPESQTPITRALVTKTILSQSEGKPFQIAVLSDTSNDDPYRYLLSLENAPVVFGTTGADQLFVICEEETECNTYGNPQFEIASFAVHHLREKQTEQVLLTSPVLLKKLSVIK